MASLRTRCIRRCDKENDGSIATAEWNALISEAFGELWGIVAESGLRYWEASATIIADGSESYLEPADVLATIGVDFLEAGTTTGTRRSLDEIMVQERSRWTGNTGEARVYALADDQLFLYPRPSSGTYLWLYIPQSTDLSTYLDDDLVDVVTADGERFLIWCVAVKALAKSESDVQLAMTERDQAREALREWAVLRAFNAPRRRIVRDGDGTDYYYDQFDSASWWNR
jgi:hypothetical protein